MRVSVVIPVLNEEATIAQVVAACAADAPEEILVIDADSTDNTVDEAVRACSTVPGARVLNWREILPDIPPLVGKGESLWRGVAAATGDIVVFVDGDLRSAQPGLVSSLVQPFSDPEAGEHIQLVKARYTRTYHGGSGGGRVTELTAKPLLTALCPQALVDQPLAGEYAIRRTSACELPFIIDYGVEIGLLLDCVSRFGAESVQQVDLPARVHRNRPLAELAPMAQMVTNAVLARCCGLGTVTQRPPLHEVLTSPPKAGVTAAFGAGPARSRWRR